MVKKFNRFSIVILTILLGELINAFSLQFLLPFKSASHPYKSVFIVMMVSVCIYYPAFIFINKYLKSFSHKYLHKTSKIAGGPFWGRILGLLIGLVIIFSGFLVVLYKRNIFIDLYKFLFS